MREIKLNATQVALVDDEDYDELVKHTWHSTFSPVRRGNWYARRQVKNGKHRLMHRVIMDPPDGMEVDHKDGDGLNNQRSNLRVCTHTQNMAGRRRFHESSTGFRGVSSRGTRFVANISGQYLGMFGTAKDAAEAYDAASYWVHGEFGCPNFTREEDPVPYQITPKDVLDIRGSVKHRGELNLKGGSAALIFYTGNDNVFALSAYGKVVAFSRDTTLLSNLLVQERAEPGFIARLLDTTVDPETACLDPAQRAARITQINAAKALTRQHTETTAANRRLQALRPSSVSLDDLLND